MLQAIEIIICIHNALEDVKRCLEAIHQNTASPYFLTVVDDASETHVGAYIDDFAADHAGMRVIRNKENIGYTRSANRGLTEARSDWAVLLNSDTIVTSGWLTGMLECALSAPTIGAVGPLSNAATFQSMPETRNGDGSFIVNMLPDGATPEDMADILRQVSVRAFPRVPILNGFCLLLSRRALDEVGYLDEVNFPRGYGEENDLCFRLVSAGYQLAIADQVYIYHAKSASFGHEQRKALIKSGVESLKGKWIGYSYSYVAEGIQTLPSLQSLRRRFKERLAA